MATIISNQYNQNGYQVRQQQDDENFVAIRTRKYTKKLVLLGILHTINAVSIFGLGIAVVDQLHTSTRSVNVNNHYTSIWVPWIFITTGILGTVLHCKPANKTLAVAHNVFAITSAALTLIMIAASGYAIKIYNCHSHKGRRYYRHPIYDHQYRRHYYKLRHYSYRHFDHYECVFKPKVGQSLHESIVGLAVIEFIFAVLSIYNSFKIFNCCKEGCPCEECYTGEQSTSSNTQVYQMQSAPSQSHYYSQQGTTHQLVHSQNTLHQQVIIQNTPASILNTPPPYSAQAPSTGNQMYEAIPQALSIRYQIHQLSGTAQASQVQENQTFYSYTQELPAAVLAQQSFDQPATQRPTVQTLAQRPIFIGQDGKQYALVPINIQSENAALPSATATSLTGNVPMFYGAFPSAASTEIVTPLQQTQSTDTSTVKNSRSDGFGKDEKESSP